MSNNKSTLLFITTELPWPANSGGRIKTFRFVQFLSKHYRVRLVCAHGLKNSETLKEIREVSGIESVQVFDTFKKRTPFNWFLGLMSFPTFNAFRVYSKQMESMMRWGIEQNDIVIVDHLEMMEMIPEKLVSKVIYHSHNAEFKLWEDLAILDTNPMKKGSIRWEADRVKLFERWVIRNTKFTFAAPNDSKLISEKTDVSLDRFKTTYHLGNDSLLKLPEIDIENNGAKIFYAGTLSWVPNHDGLVWFIRNCWKQIRQDVQEAQLIVCGNGADTHLQNLMRQSEGVEYKGFADDLEGEMKQSACAIVPLRMGSGMKIKTFDAMYRGLPLITTSTGADGIEIVHNKHALIADESLAFSQNVIHTLTQKADAKTRAKEARILAKDRYTYEAIFNDMIAHIESRD